MFASLQYLNYLNFTNYKVLPNYKILFYFLYLYSIYINSNKITIIKLQ